ncbi:hypothetical protein AB0J68_27690, partial [Micromonospora sp. NPDC049580]
AAVRRRLVAPGSGFFTDDPADRAYVAGDVAGALMAYQRRLIDDPEDSDAWVGLMLAARRGGHSDAAHTLMARPDLVRATHQAVPDTDVLTVAAALTQRR